MRDSLPTEVRLRERLLLAGTFLLVFLLAGCGGIPSKPLSGSANSAITGNAASGGAGGSATGTAPAGGSGSTSTAPNSGSTTTGGGTGTGTGTSTSPDTPTSSLPTPPAGATVFADIEDSSDNWSDCSDCAGGTVTTNYWTAPFQTTPSLDGSSRQFYVGGPGWSDALWTKKFGAQNSATHFLWDFYVYFDSTGAATLESAEYDLWQSVGGQEFMIGSQCVFSSDSWNTWDSQRGAWVTIPVGCPRFTPNTWHHIQWYVERISSTQYRYDTLVVDGVAASINQTFTANAANWDDNLGVQWQMDEGANGDPANEWIDKVKLTIW